MAKFVEFWAKFEDKGIKGMQYLAPISKEDALEILQQLNLIPVKPPDEKDTIPF